MVSFPEVFHATAPLSQSKVANKAMQARLQWNVLRPRGNSDASGESSGSSKHAHHPKGPQQRVVDVAVVIAFVGVGNCCPSSFAMYRSRPTIDFCDIIDLFPDWPCIADYSDSVIVSFGHALNSFSE
eukprot:5800104-Amphidinium_carterae.1